MSSGRRVGFGEVEVDGAGRLHRRMRRIEIVKIQKRWRRKGRKEVSVRSD